MLTPARSRLQTGASGARHAMTCATKRTVSPIGKAAPYIKSVRKRKALFGSPSLEHLLRHRTNHPVQSELPCMFRTQFKQQRSPVRRVRIYHID